MKKKEVKFSLKRKYNIDVKALSKRLKISEKTLYKKLKDYKFRKELEVKINKNKSFKKLKLLKTQKSIELWYTDPKTFEIKSKLKSKKYIQSMIEYSTKNKEIIKIQTFLVKGKKGQRIFYRVPIGSEMTMQEFRKRLTSGELKKIGTGGKGKYYIKNSDILSITESVILVNTKESRKKRITKKMFFTNETERSKNKKSKKIDNEIDVEKLPF